MQTFNGSGLIIWMADGKLKYRCISDQDEFAKELKRRRGLTPDRAIATFAINWDDQSVMSLVGEESEQ